MSLHFLKFLFDSYYEHQNYKQTLFLNTYAVRTDSPTLYGDILILLILFDV